MRPRHAAACLAASLLVAPTLTGCRPADERGLVPVAGRVTLNGGAWPQPGKLYFLPAAAADTPPASPRSTRPGFAEFETSGDFVVQTRRPGDGLMPGRYRVGVWCWRKEPSAEEPGEDPAGPEAVRNAATSALFVDIPATGSRDLVIDVRD